MANEYVYLRTSSLHSHSRIFIVSDSLDYCRLTRLERLRLGILTVALKLITMVDNFSLIVQYRSPHVLSSFTPMLPFSAEFHPSITSPHFEQHGQLSAR